jgi:hypothetical protein
MYTIDDITRSYAETALWSSLNSDSVHCGGDNPDAGENLDADYGVDDIAPATWEAMNTDVRDFVLANLADFVAYLAAGRDAESFGHDFWLTRNGHGAGFWDRGLGDLGDRLSGAAKVYGECDLYVGDDGQLHI